MSHPNPEYIAMTAADQSLAKQALARQDLELIDRKISRTQRFLARQDISKVARLAAVEHLDDLDFERDTVQMAMETHHRMTPASADAMPRRTDGCECGEYGGSTKTCEIHGYGNPTAMAATEKTS
jgi:hypothetical protein